MKKATLTPEQITSPVGKELLELTVRAALDGRLELAEIKELRQWLRANQGNQTVPAIGYLHEIMTRITADGRIDRDELVELHLAIERVIPASFRKGVKEARQAREAAAKQRVREQQRVEKAADKARIRDEREQAKAEEEWRRNRLRHEFAKVSGVTFDNDDGSDRQSIIKKCRRGEPLIFQQDPNNPFSVYATKVLWESPGFLGRKIQQIGYAPEYMAERIVSSVWTDMAVEGVILEVTGGTREKPTRGLNFAVIFSAPDVSDVERQDYVAAILAERN